VNFTVQCRGVRHRFDDISGEVFIHVNGGNGPAQKADRLGTCQRCQSSLRNTSLIYVLLTTEG
jgi:hypothetical protein